MSSKAWKTFERRVRDMFGAAYGFDFTRVANSGAGEMVKGDIMPKDLLRTRTFPFTVEVKLLTSRSISLENMLLSWKDTLWEWWCQVVVESEHNTETLEGGMSSPLLVFKTSGSGTVPLAMVRSKDIRHDLSNGVPMKPGIVLTVCIRMRKKIKMGTGWRWGKEVIGEWDETLLLGKLEDLLPLCAK